MTETINISMFKPGKCEVCERDRKVAVAACPYTAASFGYCVECIDAQAEPEIVLVYLYYYVGNHGEGLVPEVANICTYKEGEYWPWSRWTEWAKTQPDPAPPPDGNVDVDEYLSFSVQDAIGDISDIVLDLDD